LVRKHFNLFFPKGLNIETKYSHVYLPTAGKFLTMVEDSFAIVEEGHIEYFMGIF
jgi:hypothetical protein